MPSNSIETSPQVYARIGGLLYLINIAAGLFGEMFVRNALIVSGDAAATAHNIVASPSLWRLGIAGDLIMQISDVPLMLILYVLLRPVNRNLALLTILFDVIQTAVLVVNKVNLITPLLLLGNAGYLKAFAPEQLDALAYLSIALHGYGFGVGLIFFGCESLVTGFLIARSGYLPRMLGFAMQVAGVCYLTNSFALILAPALADAMFPFVLLPPFVAESAFCLWLLVKGVDMTKWNERAGDMRVGAL
jgi:hypothetical protein